MFFLSKISLLISKVCIFLGGVSLISIVCVTLLDIITRYLFKLTSGSLGFPFKGGLELVEQFMFLALLAAFVAFLERSQIIVDIFTQNLAHKIKVIIMSVSIFVFAILGAIFAWGQYELMLEAMRYGNSTQVLRIPMAPIHAIGVLLSLLLMLRALIESINILVTGNYHNAEEAS